MASWRGGWRTSASKTVRSGATRRPEAKKAMVTLEGDRIALREVVASGECGQRRQRAEAEVPETSGGVVTGRRRGRAAAEEPRWRRWPPPGVKISSPRCNNSGRTWWRLGMSLVPKSEKVILFLHGFLGTSEDWVPMMKALSPSARVIAVDLPGHGESQILQHDVENSNRFSVTVQSVADVLLKLMYNITDGEVVVVGYSMGARIALDMALNQNHKISGAVIISGSPGLRDEVSRRRRSAIDKSRAHFLLSCGLECFLETWYSSKMWASLRGHPKFDSLVATRRKHGNTKALSKVLADLSIGRQKSLWEDLKYLKRPLLIVAGEKDQKFKQISQQMCSEIRKYGGCESDGRNGQELCEMIIVPDSGHAVHVENPLPLVRAVRKFLLKLHQK